MNSPREAVGRAPNDKPIIAEKISGQCAFHNCAALLASNSMPKLSLLGSGMLAMLGRVGGCSPNWTAQIGAGSPPGL